MKTAFSGLFSLSPLSIAAVCSVVLLSGAIVWNISDTNKGAIIASVPENGADTSLSLNNLGDPVISPIGAQIIDQVLNTYSSLAEEGSSDAALAAVEEIGMNISPEVEYRTFTSADIKTDTDTSSARVLAYRAELRVALEPLLKNKEMELELFARYIESGDTANLDALRAAAMNYRTAIESSAAMKVPADAKTAHLGILNAMSAFAAMLDVLADNAQDPLASAALLKTYNGAEANMLASFDAIGAYAAKKLL